MRACFLICIASISLLACASTPSKEQSLNWGFHLDQKEIINLKILANNGNVGAANKLFGYYQYYDNNIQESIIWARKAANYGDPRSQYNLGILIDIASDSAQSKEESLMWIQRAARAGYKPAITKIIKMGKMKQP